MAARLLALSALLGMLLFTSGCARLSRQPEAGVGVTAAQVEPTKRADDSPLSMWSPHVENHAGYHANEHREKQSARLASMRFQPPTVQDVLAVDANAGSDAVLVTSNSAQPNLPQTDSIQTDDIKTDRIETTQIAVDATVIPLDLTGALSMATGQNPRIAFAAARYREAYARFEAARTLWLPSLRAGVSYNHHDGTLQASEGTVIDASRSSWMGGLGAQAVGAGSPVVPGLSAQFHAADAVFQPKIAAHGVSARSAARQVTTNDTLLDTALAYLDLLRTTQQLRIAEETHDNANSLFELTSNFASTGQGSQADADRTQTELIRRRNEVSRAQEDQRVASVRLAQLLSLDPSLEIVPLEPAIIPIDLVSVDMASGDLVATGLENRPELAEAQYLVCEAVYRYRREKYAPMLPSVLLGVSQSGFGGGLGSNLGNNRGRFDFDAAVYWELRNFGFGERAKRDETRSQYDQARALQVSMMDRVAREVVEAHEQVKSRLGRIEVAQAGVESATKSYQRDLERIRQGHGLPIEVLQSLQALDAARGEYLRSLADYNEAQFRLQRALGWPIQ